MSESPSEHDAPPPESTGLVSRLSRVDSRELLARHWTKVQPSLMAFLIASTPQFSDAEDLLQEVAAEVARRFDDYDQDRPFLPWVLWVAKLKIADFYRVRDRRQVKFIGDSLDHLVEACDRIHDGLTEEKWALERCLSLLTERSRELLRLRYFDDLTPQEISQRLNLPAGNVRTALSRVRTALASCVKSTLANDTNPYG